MLIPFCWYNPDCSRIHCWFKVVSHFCILVFIPSENACFINIKPCFTVHWILYFILLDPLIPIGSALSDHSHPQLRLNAGYLNPLVWIINLRWPSIVFDVKSRNSTVVIIVSRRNGDWESQRNCIRLVALLHQRLILILILRYTLNDTHIQKKVNICYIFCKVLSFEATKTFSNSLSHIRWFSCNSFYCLFHKKLINQIY